jgi:putative nucleotidyltransferase with HDIG domain
MKRLLFVDDERSVLDGLQLTLRKQRTQWEMVFCDSGAAALAEFAKGPFDIVVSDMRMPQMDGAQFLTEIRNYAPGTVRMVLSGHADKATMIRALPVAHQILGKPCEPNELRQLIERACRIHTLVNDPHVRTLMMGVSSLPSLPAIYQKLSEALATNAPIKVVAEIVEKDIAMSAKLLQYANSAYFGMPNRVTTVGKAVLFLGVESVRALTLTASVFDQVGTDPRIRAELDTLFSHSLQVARVAQKLLPAQAQECFTAALLHDIGELVLITKLPKAHAEILEDMAKTGRPRLVVEQEKLGMNHDELGAYLLSLWGLPLGIIEAVANHHAPQVLGETALSLSSAIYFAEGLCEPELNPPDLAFAAAIGVADKIDGWRALVTQPE